MNPFYAVLAQAAPSSDPGATEFLANLSVGTIVLVAVILTVLRLLLLSFKAPQQPGRPAEVAPFARGIAEILESLIIAGVLVFLIIRPFFVQAFFIPSESMENTLLGHSDGERGHTDTVHDHIFVNKLVYRYSEPQRGDIIVFKAPKSADMESQVKGLPQVENILIKRLIAVPGDSIWVHDNAVWLKRPEDAKFARQDECCHGDPKASTQPGHYIKDEMIDTRPNGAKFAVNGPLTLKPGELFVMGDNRNDSNDSRYWGTLERSRVLGKAALIFFPFNRIRLLTH